MLKNMIIAIDGEASSGKSTQAKKVADYLGTKHHEVVVTEDDMFNAIPEVIKNNFDDVGKNFAFEARSMHYNKKESKGIYGKATPEEISELKEEGIETELFPWIENSDN